MSKLSLLPCVSCLNSAKSFAAFDANKLLRMIEFYPNETLTLEFLVCRKNKWILKKLLGIALILRLFL